MRKEVFLILCTGLNTVINAIWGVGGAAKKEIYLFDKPMPEHIGLGFQTTFLKVAVRGGCEGGGRVVVV